MYTHTLTHYVIENRNLYRDMPAALLPAEAARLDDNRRLIAADLRRDPGSWVNGPGCLAVCDVLFADAVAELTRRPMIAGVAA
jgi:hypothetical protein